MTQQPHSKSQKLDPNLQPTPFIKGSFQVGDVIRGQIVFPEMLPLVSPGISTPPSNNHPVSVVGQVIEENQGEVIRFVLLTQDVSSTETEIDKDMSRTIINLRNMESYNIWC